MAVRKTASWNRGTSLSASIVTLKSGGGTRVLLEKSKCGWLFGMEREVSDFYVVWLVMVGIEMLW